MFPVFISMHLEDGLTQSDLNKCKLKGLGSTDFSGLAVILQVNEVILRLDVMLLIINPELPQARSGARSTWLSLNVNAGLNVLIEFELSYFLLSSCIIFIDFNIHAFSSFVMLSFSLLSNSVYSL